MLGNTSILALSGLVSFGLFVLTYLGPLACVLLVWYRLQIKPGRLMQWCAVAWLSVGLLVSIFSDLKLVWWITLALWCLVALVDFIAVLRVRTIEVERELPGRFAINVDGEVKLVVRNHSRLPLNATVYDGIPEEAEAEGLPWTGVIPAGGKVEIFYPLKFVERGPSAIDCVHIAYGSILKLWLRQVKVGTKQETKVYPNYEPVIRFALLAMESRPEQMGIVMKNRAGLSKDFHQLRDYQLGDTLSRVDWKATSKKLALISRDYQEQRDQNLILALDCGRRMRAYDGDLPQFDHCLNAMLLLAYVALRQGDQVGILSFGGQERWLPPVKGVNAMTTILNHLYDYKTSTSPSDYAEAAERFLVRQRRRSLVVFLSNIRGEDASELIEPLRLVRRKHVVVLANLREQEVVEQMNRPIETLDDALTVGATQQYLDERRSVLNELASHGIHSVESTARDLPVELANQYLMAREGV